jgi:hypothetical protein
MGNTYEDFTDIESLDHVLDTAADGHDGLAGGVGTDFHIAPRDSPPPARSYRFEDRLFRRPTTGKMLCGLLAALAIGNLCRRVNPGEKQLAVTLNHSGDPKAFGDIGADSHDFGHDGQYFFKEYREKEVRLRYPLSHIDLKSAIRHFAV